MHESDRFDPDDPEAGESEYILLNGVYFGGPGQDTAQRRCLAKSARLSGVPMAGTHPSPSMAPSARFRCATQEVILLEKHQ